MRHLSDIKDYHISGNVLAKTRGKPAFRIAEGLGFKQLAYKDSTAYAVGDFNSDGALVGNRRFNAHAVGRHVQRDIIDQTDDKS